MQMDVMIGPFGLMAHLVLQVRSPCAVVCSVMARTVALWPASSSQTFRALDPRL